MQFIIFLYPSMTPIAKSLESHISSKGKDQLGDSIIGAKTSLFFKSSKTCIYSTKNSNEASLSKRLQRD